MYQYKYLNLLKQGKLESINSKVYFMKQEQTTGYNKMSVKLMTTSKWSI